MGGSEAIEFAMTHLKLPNNSETKRFEYLNIWFLQSQTFLEHTSLLSFLVVENADIS